MVRLVPTVQGREGLGCGGRRRPGPSASISLPVLHQSLLSRHHRPHTASFQRACDIFKCLVCYLQPSVLLEASSPSRRAFLVARGKQMKLHGAHFSPLPLSTRLPTPLLLSRHFFRLPDVGCLHLIWRCPQRSVLLRGYFSSTPIFNCIRSLLQSPPRSAHIGYDTHNTF